MRYRTRDKELYLRVAGAALIIIVAGALGLLLGALSMGPAPETEKAPKSEEATSSTAIEAPPPAEEDPPLYLYVNLTPGADATAAAEEVAMASAAGIHSVVAAVAPPWPDASATPATPPETADAPAEGAPGPSANDGIAGVLAKLMQADPKARVILAVDLNPPESWLNAHGDAAVLVDGKPGSLPCLASATWREAAKQALTDLAGQVASSTHAACVSGYLLQALEEGRWYRTGPYDRSEANTAAFRAWLGRHYLDETQLRQAWAAPEATRASAAIPDEATLPDPARFLMDPAAAHSHMDFLACISEATADAIADLASAVKAASGERTIVLAAYGHAFDLASARAGHCALGRLLDSAVDGFVGPVSYADAGIGGAGGFVGPVHSALCHDKQWFVLDNTRTGIKRDPVAGTVQRIAGFVPDEVFNVMRRNFAASLAHGLGLVWADTESDGRFLDTQLWKRFGQMQAAYKEVWARSSAEAPGLDPLTHPCLTVVVDEKSRFVEHPDSPLAENFLPRLRDCALRAGVPVQFCLFDDVVNGRAPKAAVYLFANAFHVTPDERQRLHLLFEETRAGVIWLYAPGWFDGTTASADNIGLTARLTVKAIDEALPSGSKYAIDGKWMARDEEFGAGDPAWAPLFYVEDPDTDVLATYRGSERASVAWKMTERGWGSVFVADPGMTPGLLREILWLLEQHIYTWGATEQVFDVTHFGPDIVALYGLQPGEREMDLGGWFSAQDALEPEIGWVQKRNLSFAIRAGETRILKLTPTPVQE